MTALAQRFQKREILAVGASSRVNRLEMMDIPRWCSASLAATAGAIEDVLSQGPPGTRGPAAGAWGVLGAMGPVGEASAGQAGARQH